MKKSQKGFSLVELIIVTVVLGSLGFAGFTVFTRLDGDKKNETVNSKTDSSLPKDTQVENFIWQQSVDGWQATEKAPNCPAQPMLKTPADISKVTSVLYPGQTRGSYKPHGGLRFDNIKDTIITVTSPMDGFIVKGSRTFAEGTTEIQYGFDIMNNCGVMTRIGHLSELTPSLQKIADKFPEATTNSSQLSIVNPAVYIKQGDVLATKSGLKSESNTFFDWGVYDYRRQNDASKKPEYQSTHQQGKELSWYAVCWLKDWLPAGDSAKLLALPAGDGESGKKSDYCDL